MLRIGIIGCGWFAPFHAKALAAMRDRARVVWAADTNEERARAVAERCGNDCKAITDYRAGLRDVDAVVVILPHHLHRPAAVDCLNAGVHVLMEKPLATSVAEADDMIAAAKRNKRVLMVAYPHRYRPAMRRFKEAITGGEFGKLIMLDGFMDEALQGYADLGWISKRKTLGGGVLFSSSPHMIDTMLWIAGDARRMHMAGARSGVNMEGEDTAVSVIDFASGVIGVTRHTWASPSVRTWYTLTAECTKAWVTLTTTPLDDLYTRGAECRWQTRVIARSQAGESVLVESDEGLDLRGEWDHFLDCIAAGEEPQTGGTAGRRLIELVHNAYAEAGLR